MERLLFRRFLLILMIGPLALGVIVMRTLMLIVTLSLASEPAVRLPAQAR